MVLGGRILISGLLDSNFRTHDAASEQYFFKNKSKNCSLCCCSVTTTCESEMEEMENTSGIMLIIIARIANEQEHDWRSDVGRVDSENTIEA